MRQFINLQKARKLTFRDTIRRSHDEKAVVSRPVALQRSNSLHTWERELVLFLSAEPPFVAMSQRIVSRGGSIDFHQITRVSQAYSIDLPIYTVAVLPQSFQTDEFDAIDIGGILRRATPDCVVVLADSTFSYTSIANDAFRPFCDITFSLCDDIHKLKEMITRLRASGAVIH